MKDAQKSKGKQGRVYGAVRETGKTQMVEGILCDVVKMHFPANDSGDKWRWFDAYRFTAPGWDECTIVGLAATKRTIRGRTDPAVLNTMGINPYKDAKDSQSKSSDDSGRVSVLQEIRESQETPRQLQGLQQSGVRDVKNKKSEIDL